MQKRLTLRVAMIAVLMLLLLIPLGMISGIVSDRQHLQQQVENTVSGSFAGPQRMAGPILVVPYVQREIITVTDEKGKQIPRTTEHQRQTFFVPEQSAYDGQAAVEAKYKGIYKTLVYQADGSWRSLFDIPANLGLQADPAMITVGNAYLAFGVRDVRGLKGSPTVSWGDRELTFVSGSGFESLGDGLHADVGRLDIRERHRYEVKAKLDLGGMRSLAFAPLGKSTSVQLRSAWKHPNFGGRFLPQTKKIDDNGFTAKWEISHLASKNGDLLLRGLKDPLSLESFDVSFIEPVNIYQQAERAVKYGILFVALTFAAFFLFETLKSLQIHPLQYGLVGLALAVFFLLLVSLSEHISFPMAYLAASISCVMLIGYYLSFVLGGWRRGSAFAVKLAVLYAVLYGLLLSEDNALMLGSVLLFMALALIMVLTRRVNWYQLGTGNIDV